MSDQHGPIHAIVMLEGDWLVAQCLEHDIATQAKTITELVYQLQSTLIGHLLAAKQEGTSLEDIPRAPQEYWDRWASSTSVRAETDSLPWVPFPVLPETQLRFA